MPRHGNLELTVIKQDGTPFGEVASQGRHYIVARPGETFSVKATLHNSPEPSQQYPGLDAHYFAKCQIDGKDVGHMTRLQALHAAPTAHLPKKLRTDLRSFECTFSYTLLGVGEAVQYKFADVAIDEEAARVQDTPGQGAESKVGTISVSVEMHYYENYECAPRYGASLPQAGATCSKGLGKKALLAPTLSTAAGERLSGRQYHLSNRVARKVGGSTIIGPVVVSYQTESVLLLRKILDPTIPEHLALTSYANMPDEPSDEEEEVAITPANPAATRAELSPSTAARARADEGPSLAEQFLASQRGGGQPVKQEGAAARAAPTMAVMPEVIDLTDL